MGWWQIYIEAWAAAALLSALLTWWLRSLAPRLGFMDRPLQQQHKRHRQPTPVLGGVAMYLAWVLTVGGGLATSVAFRRLISPQVMAYLPGVQTVLPQLLTIAMGATALVALGVLDDRRPLTPLTKLAWQFCAAGAVACYGVRITLFLANPFLTWALTTFWILFVINAINFSDNMDGLAAGMTAIAALLFAFVAGVRDQYFVAVLAAVTSGVASGFLVLNRPPASIFMGDAGSHLLGYLLAVIGALTTFYTPAEGRLSSDTSPTLAPILIPLLVLLIPIFDLVAVVIIRRRHGRPIYVGDHAHISHRFEKMGLSRAQAVLAVHLLAFATGAGAVALLWVPFWGAVVVFLQAGAMLLLVSLLHTLGPERHPEPARTPEPDAGTGGESQNPGARC